MSIPKMSLTKNSNSSSPNLKNPHYLDVKQDHPGVEVVRLMLRWFRDMINNPRYSEKLKKSNMFGLNTIGALVADYTGNLTFIYNHFAKFFIKDICEKVKDKHDAETMIYTWILNEKLLTREEINKEDITPMVTLVYGFSRHCSKPEVRKSLV